MELPVYDLGCGDGRIVIMAAEKFGARGVGVDFNPERVEEARAEVQKKGLQDKVEIILQDGRFVSPANHQDALYKKYSDKYSNRK